MLEIGSVLDGKYKILSEIGHGGMSVVYMALNEKANKTWAVKVIRKDGKLDFNVVRQGLVAEIETLKKLRHPSLPSIVDVIEDNDTFIIVMDYIEGNSLDKSIEEYGAQPQELVIQWAMQICDVLGYLHSCDPPIIYRDMKPANIMLKPDGNIALIDFGTAKTYEIELGETTGIGTIGYAAPEQYIGSGYGRTDARTDIYCLGMTLYHLLTNKDPCKNVISDRSIRAVNPSLSHGLDKIIKKCTEQNPDDRYQSCEELLYALEHYNELSDAYRKRQKKKLKTFSAVAVMSFIFAIASVFSFSMASKTKAKSYDSLIEQAKSSEYTDKERCDFLKEAIKISPERSDAYINLVDLFRNTGDGEDLPVLTREEAQNFVQLRVGFQDKNLFGLQSNVLPLEKLKSGNSKGFAQVCEEIGFAYWFNYEVESERYTLATSWFADAAKESPIAKTFYEIGECRSDIKKYRDQNRTEKMYSIYNELWNKLTALYDEAMSTDSLDIKILTLKEVVDCISSNISRFSFMVNNDDIITVLSSVSSEIDSLYKETEIDDIIVSLDSMKIQTKEALERIGSVSSKSDTE